MPAARWADESAGGQIDGWKGARERRTEKVRNKILRSRTKDRPLPGNECHHHIRCAARAARLLSQLFRTIAVSLCFVLGDVHKVRRDGVGQRPGRHAVAVVGVYVHKQIEQPEQRRLLEGW